MTARRRYSTITSIIILKNIVLGTLIMTADRISSLVDRLEEAGKRATPQRYAVCQALVEHGGHPTVADIFERVRAIFPMISQATVYNTIATLEELGMLQKIELLHHEHAHYDLEPRPHINVVCTRCSHIIDIHTDTLEALISQVSVRSGYQIERNGGIVLYGRCPNCLRR